MELHRKHPPRAIYNSEEELFLGEEEVEVFHAKQEKFFKEDNTFHKVIVGDSNARIGPRMQFQKSRSL